MNPKVFLSTVLSGVLIIVISYYLTVPASYVDNGSGSTAYVAWTYTENSGNPYISFDYSGHINGGGTRDNPDHGDTTLAFSMSGTGSPEVTKYATRETCPYLWTFYSNGVAACHFSNAMSRLAGMNADYSDVTVELEGVAVAVTGMRASGDNLVFNVPSGTIEDQSIHVYGDIYLAKQSGSGSSSSGSSSSSSSSGSSSSGSGSGSGNAGSNLIDQFLDWLASIVLWLVETLGVWK